MATTNEKSGILAAAAAGVIWGLLGLIIRTLGDLGLSCMQMSFLRYLITSAVLGVYLAVTDRSQLRIGLKVLPVLAIVGVFGNAINSTTYFMAMERIEIALATIVQYTAPFIVLLISVLIFRERLTKVKLAAVVLAFIGCIFCTGLFTSSVTADVYGLSLAAVAAFCFATYTVGSKAASREGCSPMAALFYSSLFCWIFCLMFCDPLGALGTVASSVECLSWALFLGIGVTLLPFGLFNYALSRIEAGKAAIVSYLEPLSAAVVGLVFYNESITIGLVIGIMMIFMSVVMISGIRVPRSSQKE